jgi:hypothetical protein
VTVFARVSDVVWRLAPDRVIARHALTELDDDGVDLHGTAALVWVALDEPATLDEVSERLASEGLEREPDDLAEVVDQLVTAGWLRRSDDGTGVA